MTTQGKITKMLKKSENIINAGKDKKMEQWNFGSAKAHVEIKVEKGGTKIKVDSNSDSQGMFLAFTGLAREIIAKMKTAAPEYDIVGNLQKAVLAANDMYETEKNSKIN